MKRLKAHASRTVATATLALALLAAAPPSSAPRSRPPPAPVPLAGEDPPPLTPVLDPAPREPRPELRVAAETPRLRERG